MLRRGKSLRNRRKNIEKWKNSNYIINNHSIYIFERPGFKIINSLNAKIISTRAPLLDISSTLIRDLIKRNKSIRFLVPNSVEEIINKELYYKSELENPTKQ